MKDHAYSFLHPSWKSNPHRNGGSPTQPEVPFHYKNTPKAATTPTANPPTPGTLPSGAAAPGVSVAESAAAVLAGASVDVAVAELTTVELITPSGTSSGFRVPHFGQSSEPGFSSRHCRKEARQIELGTEPRYSSMFAGVLPSVQMQT
jgi:hypothetical protein